MPSSTGLAATPIFVSPNPHSTASSSTGSTSPSAKAPTNAFGMMCMTKSVNPWMCTWFAKRVATEASRFFGSMCMPAPGWISRTVTRPVMSARIVSA